MTPPPVAVNAEPGGRLETLAAMYRVAKDEADAAAERLKTITDALKLELANAAPGAPTVDLTSPTLAAPLRLQARTQWRLDTKKLKAEAPDLYVRYAVQNTRWELRSLTHTGRTA